VARGNTTMGSDAGSWDLKTEIEKVRHQNLLFGGPGVEDCFSFGPWNFPSAPETAPTEIAIRDVIRQETPDGCVLLGVCPRDGLRYISFIGFASCRTPPAPAIGDWHAELRYPQPSDALAGIGVVDRKEDVAERHFDETTSRSRIAENSNLFLAPERPAVGDWHACLRSSYKEPDTGMIIGTPGAIVRWENTENTTESHFDEPPNSVDNKSVCTSKFIAGALEELTSALREMEDDRILFVGFDETGEHYVAGSICIFERPRRVRPTRILDFADWRVRLRRWDMAGILDHGGTIDLHHLNGIHDGHFDEEPLPSAQSPNDGIRDAKTAFKDFAYRLWQIEEQSEAPGYQYDGRGTEDRQETGATMLVGSRR
jgi:hypothetical protein